MLADHSHRPPRSAGALSSRHRVGRWLIAVDPHEISVDHLEARLSNDPREPQLLPYSESGELTIEGIQVVWAALSESSEQRLDDPLDLDVNNPLAGGAKTRA